MALAPRPPGRKLPLKLRPIEDTEFATREKERDIREEKQMLDFEEKKLSRNLVKRLFQTFFFVNLGVYAYIVVTTILQFARPPAGSPLITEKVVWGLIAGSATQLGALALAVGLRPWVAPIVTERRSAIGLPVATGGRRFGAMVDELLIRLNPAAHARLLALMQHYGDTRPETMISRALGLLEMLEPYVSREGILTIVDPNAGRNEQDAGVELVFENMQARSAQQRAAE